MRRAVASFYFIRLFLALASFKSANDDGDAISRHVFAQKKPDKG
jgi:hypothetical protein